MIQAALLGGLFIGILSALPIVNIANCCCLWITGGGVLAAYLTQQNERLPIGYARAAMAGLAAGLSGAFVWLIAATAIDVVMAPLQERMVAEMMENARDMPPEVRQWLERLGTQASTPVRIAAGFAFQLIAGVMFATLGGLLGAAFFTRPSPPTIPGDVVPPPLPPQ